MRIGYTILAILVLLSCNDRGKKENAVSTGGAETKQPRDSIVEEHFAARHILLGHTRNANPAENYVDRRITHAFLSRFSSTVLLGDISFYSTQNDTILNTIDSLFKFSEEHVYWAPGNHDYERPDALQRVTKKTYPIIDYHHGTTWIVVDDQDEQGKIVKTQLKLIQNCLDTITSSTNVVFASHQLLWLMDNGKLQESADSVVNGYVGDCGYCLKSNNFYSDIYPKLTELAEKGVQVICVAGDLGHKVGHFEHISAENVVFLGVGLNAPNGGKILVFNQVEDTGKIAWQFEELR